MLPPTRPLAIRSKPPPIAQPATGASARPRPTATTSPRPRIPATIEERKKIGVRQSSPAATGVGLYAWADPSVTGAAASAVPATTRNWSSDVDGFRFKLTPGSEPIRARQVIDLRLEMERIGGGTVPLEVIMQAYAHLVAFDDQRSGYAHMHPLESDITQRPDPEHPVLTFKLRLPQSGRYVIWSEVQIAGRQVFAPFWFDAVE